MAFKYAILYENTCFQPSTGQLITGQVKISGMKPISEYCILP